MYEPSALASARPATGPTVPDGLDVVEVATTAPVAGGAALARQSDGRVMFVHGALPDERVVAAVTERRKDFTRARVVAVMEPSPHRIEAPCPYLHAGCGGCDLQHADPAHQPELKRRIVVDALRRLGRLGRDAEPRVDLAPPLPAWGFRTTVRAGVDDAGRAGFRLARDHDIVAVDHCLVAHPLVDELLRIGRFDGCDEVTLRVGAATGERLVVGHPTAAGVEVPDDLDALVVGDDGLAGGTRAWIHDVVGGHRFRISARSFFQTRPDGAAALAATVTELGGHELAGAHTVVDAYAGVGLFAALSAPPDAHVLAVESGVSSTVDARHNLVDRNAKVIRSTVERWRPAAADVVIADPARTGLAKVAAAVLARTNAAVIVLVSCDAAALGRDAALLADQGYLHDRSVLVDLFPQTHHVEVVTRFVRG